MPAARAMAFLLTFGGLAETFTAAPQAAAFRMAQLSNQCFLVRFLRQYAVPAANVHLGQRGLRRRDRRRHGRPHGRLLRHSQSHWLRLGRC